MSLISKSKFPQLIPLITKIQDRFFQEKLYDSSLRFLYDAIAKQKTEQANALIQRTFDKRFREFAIIVYYQEYACNSIDKFPAKIYENLFYQCISQGLFPGEKAINELLLWDKERLMRVLKNYFLKPTNPLGINLEMLLVFAEKNYEMEDMLKFVNSGIKYSDVHTFEIYTQYAQKYNDNDTIKLLFLRIKNDDNPHVYLAAAEALLVFRKQEYRTRLIKLRNETPHLKTGWGGDQLDEMLK